MKNTVSRQHTAPVRATLISALTLTVLLGSASSPAYARTFDEIMEDAKGARELGEMDRTVALLREAYEMDPRPELLNNIARIYEQEGRYREAYKTYKQVSNDPEAEPNLRNLDAARAAELRPMLTKAWVLPRVMPKDTRLLVDGGEPAASVTDEIPLERGEHVIEVSHKKSGQVHIQRESYPIGRRSILTLDLTRPGANGGRIRIADATDLESLVIDGYRLKTPLNEASVIRLSAGPHEIVTTRKGKPAVVSEVRLARGDLRALAGIVAAGTVQAAPTTPPPAAPSASQDPIPAAPEQPDTPGAETAEALPENPQSTPPAAATVAPVTTDASTAKADGPGGGVRVVCNVQNARGRIGGGKEEPLTHTWSGVAAGTHFVTVTADSYSAWTRKVIVKTGRTVEIVAELSRTGRLKVTADGSSPSEVFFEGALMGKTPALLDVETGTHVIVVKRADGKTEEAHVTVGEEGATTFHAYFGRKPGRVRHRAMPYSAQPIDKGFGSLDAGLGWPYLGQVRINTGLNEHLDIGLTWQSLAHHLNEFLVRGKWLVARSRAFAVGVQGELGFGIGQGDRASVVGHVQGLASILIREKAAVTARLGVGVSRDWAEDVKAHSTLQIPLGLSVEVRLNKFWNLALLVEGEPITNGRDVFDSLHDPLGTFDFDRPSVRGSAGVSLLF